MTRRLRVALLVLSAVAEPICHALGIPHPEGLPELAANALTTLPEA